MKAGSFGRVVRGQRIASLLLGGTMLAACAGGASTAPTGGASPAAATTAPTATATEAAAASEATPSTTATAVPTTLDPCELVTAAEASQLAGATFGPGAESETEGHLKICTYGGKTINVFSSFVAQAPDVATAQAAKADALASAQKDAPIPITLVQLPDFADGAVFAAASAAVGGKTISISGFYVLSGTVFFAMSDVVLDGPAPTSEQWQAQAQVILGRIG